MDTVQAIVKSNGKANGQSIGYVRISSVGQNPARQQAQLEGLELDRIFEDRMSGKNTERPALQAMLAHVREGDTVVVHSLDRLGRSLTDLRQLVAGMTAKGITVKFLKENLTFTGEANPMQELLLNLLGSVAEFERALIRERQTEGIELAKLKGDVYKGRKPSLSAEDVTSIRTRIANGETKASLAKEYKITRMTLDNRLKAIGYRMAQRSLADSPRI
jgi:DNA invertase Pin-like site-specific DNA recombinase